MHAALLLLSLQMNYNNKNMLVGALLVAGYDKHNGGQVRGRAHAKREARLEPGHLRQRVTGTGRSMLPMGIDVLARQQ